MSERKQWSQEQDAVLKFLKEEEKMGKWSHIARKMAQDHKMFGRNGKQCRQRYYNHLDSSIKREEWTTEQEQHLYQLHDQIGNKWALIAQKMNGRTDNCVKNHFYSKLRKALRKLNKVIHQNFKKQFREIRMTVLYKIIEATDDKFKEKQTISSQISLHSRQLKNMLLDYSNDQDNQFKGDFEKIRNFIADIYKFSGNYKRKPKKSRQNTCQMKKIINLPIIQKFKCSSDIQDDASDDYINASEEQSFQLGSKQLTENKALSQSKILMPTPIRHSVSMSNAQNQNQNQNLYLSNSMNVEYVLNNAGILQDAYLLSMSDFLKRSLSFSLCSEFSQPENNAKTEFNIEETEKDSDAQKNKNRSLFRSS